MAGVKGGRRQGRQLAAAPACHTGRGTRARRACAHTHNAPPIFMRSHACAHTRPPLPTAQVAVIELDYVEDAKALRADEFEAVSGRWRGRCCCLRAFRRARGVPPWERRAGHPPCFALFSCCVSHTRTHTHTRPLPTRARCSLPCAPLTTPLRTPLITPLPTLLRADLHLHRRGQHGRAAGPRARRGHEQPAAGLRAGGGGRAVL